MSRVDVLSEQLDLGFVIQPASFADRRTRQLMGFEEPPDVTKQ